ncbi:MAG TPA: thermonuclease family protein [Nocardioidaceae bacterium]|nr:thermonuclease family protein [Nocardioidaceae bacterium]
MHSALRRAFVMPVIALSLAAGTVLASSPAQAVDKDCGDFASQKAAQIFFLENGGPDYDPHNLDADGDGVVCESNPAPYYYGLSLPDSGTTSKPKVVKQRARVVKVVDGDTLTVRLASGVRRKVRLIGIDTPEVYSGVECGGRKASASMRRLTPKGTRVVLVSDPTQDKVDRYGRLLRYVMKSGRDMNRAQVNRGWATVYVYDNNPFKRVQGYRKAQRSAKADPRGVWSMCH